MAESFENLSSLYAAPFDDVIDVRSPAEFAEDHIPGALSLPVLSNEERAQVGTIYTQDSPFKARKLGAALVSRNAAAHLEGPLADRDGGWRPLVYCWRGGQRSGAFAVILQQIGWRADTLDGGYRAYRRLVVQLLHETTLPHRLIILDGNTGTGKTEILIRLQASGVQVIDLEGLAAHRGSLLGATDNPQPAQKAFESALAQALTGLDPSKPTVLEAESSKIGGLLIPPSLWKSMCAAPRIRLNAPIKERARYLTRAYADLLHDRAALAETLAPLVAFQGRERVSRWQDLARSGDHVALATELMAEHYDPRYARSAGSKDVDVLADIQLKDMSDRGLDVAVETLRAELRKLGTDP